MELLKNINLALAFLLELCMLAALGYWGFTLDQGLAIRVGAGLGVPLLAAVIWGVLMAPRAAIPLADAAAPHCGADDLRPGDRSAVRRWPPAAGAQPSGSSMSST